MTRTQYPVPPWVQSLADTRGIHDCSDGATACRKCDAPTLLIAQQGLPCGTWERDGVTFVQYHYPPYQYALDDLGIPLTVAAVTVRLRDGR